MIKIRSYSMIFVALIAGCGPQFVLPETKERPAQIVVSAYTQSGCLEELHAAAKAGASR